jgi:hypothetical protein
VTAALFILLLLLFSLPGYVFAIGLYGRCGWTALPGERAAIGGLVVFAILGVLALPAFAFDLPLSVIMAVYVVPVVVAAVILHGRQMFPIGRLPAAILDGVRRDWLLLLFGAAAFAMTVPFCRYYPDGADMLYFVGVVRKYICRRPS